MKQTLMVFLFGVTTGALAAFSIKYPVTAKVIADANAMCQTNHDLDKLKVGLSGKMYNVRCKNGKVFDLK